jgi:predicted O-linked N-acetylglucosamine transferase (SPINDLY family)/predicted SAM-dependent methyltransferase
MRNINQGLAQKQRNAAEALLKEGMTLKQAGSHAQAIAKFRAVVRFIPGHLAALNDLAGSLSVVGDWEESIAIYEKAICLHPGVPQLHHNKAKTLRTQGHIDKAIEAYRQALALKPDYASACYGLAIMLDRKGDLEQSRVELERALTLDPTHFAARLQMVACHDLPLCNFDSAESHHSMLRTTLAAYAASASTGAVEILYNVGYLNLFAPFAPEAVRDAARRASKLLQAVAQRPALTPRDSNPDRRLKIGYVSPNFSDHPVGHVMRSFFSAHDHSQFEVYAYATARKRRESGDFYATIKAGVDHFVDIDTMTARDAATRIAQDGIDILVDLDGYMELKSPAIFSHRPAPIQVFWLGHAGGLGLDFMDYLIADSVVLPKGEEAAYTEAVVRLPEVYHVADRAPISTLLPSRGSQQLSEGAFVFCAFNNPAKIDRRIFLAWMSILAAVPESVLWLSPPARYGDHRNNLRREAQAAGIDPDRLVFASHVPDKAAHLARHQLADLFLDTVTVNAATTALDALSAGLPVLTCKGERFANRMAETFLRAMCLDDLIAPTLDAYVERAVFLARDRPARETLRRRVGEAREASPVFDTARFTRHLETGYRMMWERHVAGHPPATLEVPCMAKESQTASVVEVATPVVEPLRLHIGGKEPKAGWKIVNIQAGPDVDFIGNCTSLRFEDNTVDEVYASHVLEHLGFRNELPQALQEIRRVLKPGGVLRMSVPDLEVLCRLFVDPAVPRDQKFSLMRHMFGAQEDEHDFHKVGLTWDFVVSFFKQAGFSTARRVEEFRIFNDFSSYRRFGVFVSLNVEATK